MGKVRNGTASLAEMNLALGNRGTALHFAVPWRSMANGVAATGPFCNGATGPGHSNGMFSRQCNAIESYEQVN